MEQLGSGPSGSEFSRLDFRFILEDSYVSALLSDTQESGESHSGASGNNRSSSLGESSFACNLRALTNWLQQIQGGSGSGNNHGGSGGGGSSGGDGGGDDGGGKWE